MTSRSWCGHRDRQYILLSCVGYKRTQFFLRDDILIYRIPHNALGFVESIQEPAICFATIGPAPFLLLFALLFLYFTSKYGVRHNI